MEAAVGVVGGGPAGAALAIELARLGVPVLVITSPRPRRRFEGLSDRTVALLQRQGFAHACATLGEAGERQAHWNGVASRHNREYLVERSAFDRALCDDLRAQGITVLTSEVRSLQWQQNHWHITCGAQVVRVGFVVEARGRAAPAGQTRLRGPASLAVARFYHGPTTTDATAVIPFADGWAWLGRAQDGRRMVQFTVDADSVPGAGHQALTSLHQRLCADVPEVAEWVPDGVQADGPAVARACDTYLRDDLAGAAFLRVGDAACGYDPLSGQGVFLALAGALSAAAVVRTCVERPQDGALARQFYSDRLLGAFAEKTALGVAFYQQEQRWADRPFWQRRREVLPVPVPTVAGLQRVRRPVLADGWITEQEVLLTPRHPLGVWRVEDVPVPALLDHVRQSGASLGDYAARHQLALPQVERAALWLQQVGALAS
ncbi:flavin-dependent monooxygenase QhpG [Insolitispirillum peregrinum]|uniref:Dehydrogenase (Flavoprotein) n=1 Tax=Insolitispirillum peregrinum TaxID=80876 RepID=A0A1N7QBK4_9PROT|nr:FAD-dependent monooxygenase [Insolitispirillum peregrinum]SIT20231.1 Dehydrogenase (flavoprotein) [Insolitispirillum peregrinum]